MMAQLLTAWEKTHGFEQMEGLEPDTRSTPAKSDHGDYDLTETLMTRAKDENLHHLLMLPLMKEVIP